MPNSDTEPTLEETLKATSNEALVTTLLSLTHQIHEVEGSKEPGSLIKMLDLRERRDIVQAEILYRMGAAHR